MMGIHTQWCRQSVFFCYHIINRVFNVLLFQEKEESNKLLDALPCLVVYKTCVFRNRSLRRWRISFWREGYLFLHETCRAIRTQPWYFCVSVSQAVLTSWNDLYQIPFACHVDSHCPHHEEREGIICLCQRIFDVVSGSCSFPWFPCLLLWFRYFIIIVIHLIHSPARFLCRDDSLHRVCQHQGRCCMNVFVASWCRSLCILRECVSK